MKLNGISRYILTYIFCDIQSLEQRSLYGCFKTYRYTLLRNYNVLLYNYTLTDTNSQKLDSDSGYHTHFLYTLQGILKQITIVMNWYQMLACLISNFYSECVFKNQMNMIKHVVADFQKQIKIKNMSI